MADVHAISMCCGFSPAKAANLHWYLVVFALRKCHVQDLRWPVKWEQIGIWHRNLEHQDHIFSGLDSIGGLKSESVPKSYRFVPLPKASWALMLASWSSCWNKNNGRVNSVRLSLKYVPRTSNTNLNLYIGKASCWSLLPSGRDLEAPV